MKKTSWMDKPITWRGYFKFAGWASLAGIVISIAELWSMGFLEGTWAAMVATFKYIFTKKTPFDED